MDVVKEPDCDQNFQPLTNSDGAERKNSSSCSVQEQTHKLKKTIAICCDAPAASALYLVLLIMLKGQFTQNFKTMIFSVTYRST